MKKLLSLIIALAFVLTAIPTLAVPSQNIVEIASANSDFSILVEALVAANLDDTLKGTGPFTVFAPTNAAFADLLTALGITKADLLAHPDLSKVLLYHVVSGSVLSTDLTDGMEATTVQGEKVRFNLGVTPPKVNDSQITSPDLMATNGVIHVIDKVLVPDEFILSTKNIVETAVANPDFSILVAALQKANLVSALEGEGPFTVFAPTNAAFTALLTSLDITADDLLNQPDLAKVLLHHVISGKVLSSALTDGLEATTLNEDKLVFDLSGTTPMVNGAKISTVDLETRNGVIHVIDSVMVPANFTLEDLSPTTADGIDFGILLIVFLASALLLLNRKTFAKRTNK